jgi:anti-sigma B factor antagonist
MNLDGKLIISHEQDENDDLVLILSGDLDVRTAPQLRNFIERVVNEGVANVRLDLSRLSYLDSSGFIALVDATRRTKGARCRLDLANMPRWMTEFFDLKALEA